MHRLQERGTVSPLTPGRGDSTLRRRRLATIALVAAFVVAADQVTKTLAIDKLARAPTHVIGPLSFALSFNTGVAFSIGAGLTFPIIIVVFVTILLLAWFARGTPRTPVAIGTGMILGGALGNLADRLFRGRNGAVVDFVHLGFWPTFNLADASIVIGTIIVLLSTVLSERVTGEPGDAKGDTP